MNAHLSCTVLFALIASGFCILIISLFVPDPICHFISHFSKLLGGQLCASMIQIAYDVALSVLLKRLEVISGWNSQALLGVFLSGT